MIIPYLIASALLGTPDRCERTVDFMLRSERLTGAAMELSGACQTEDPAKEAWRLMRGKVERLRRMRDE